MWNTCLLRESSLYEFFQVKISSAESNDFNKINIHVIKVNIMFFFAPDIVIYVLEQEHSCEGTLLAVYINDAKTLKDWFPLVNRF